MLNLLRRRVFRWKIKKNAYYAARCKDCVWYLKKLGWCAKDTGKRSLNPRKDWCGDYSEH